MRRTEALGDGGPGGARGLEEGLSWEGAMPPSTTERGWVVGRGEEVVIRRIVLLV